MSHHNGRVKRSRQNIPVVTVVLMVTAIVFTLFLLMTSISEPYIGESNFRFGALLIFVPPALFFIGAAAAWPDRFRSKRVSIGWTVLSAVLGLIYVPAVLTLTVLVGGP